MKLNFKTTFLTVLPRLVPLSALTAWAAEHREELTALDPLASQALASGPVLRLQ